MASFGRGVIIRLRAPLCAAARPRCAKALSTRAHGAAIAPFTPKAACPSTRLGAGTLGQKRFFNAKTEVITPELGGESVTEGSIGSWNFQVGDNVKKGDILAVIETDKVTIDVKTEVDGQLTEILVQVDDTCKIGQPLAVLGPPSADAPTAKAPAAAASAPAAPAATPAAPAAAAAPAAPATPSTPAEKAPDPKPVVKPTPAAATPAPSAAPAATAPSANKPERREKMKRMRLAIARNLKDAQNTLAMLTTFQEVDMSGLIKMRNEYKDLFEKSHGAKLGFQSPFFMASAYALQQIPAINAYIDNDTNEIVYRDYINIGFAAATPKGLVTPVIRNMQSKSLKDVEDDFAHLAGLAKQDKLSLDDITGNTFTITNGGVFGSMLGTPLIGSVSTSAALGLHATTNRPVVLKNGEIAVRPIMYLALTYDHRLVDGREAVTFLCMIRDQVQDPRRMLLSI